MSDRFLCLVVSGAVGLVLGACGESSTPDPGGSTAGSSSSGAGGGGSSSAGAGGSSAGAAGSASGGMAGTATAGSAGAAGAAGSAGAGGAGGSGGGGGAGGSANGTKMSFFVSSTPPTGTGKLGGLAGADAHCKALAMAAGAVRTAWVAYMSVTGTNAKDRIGAGPWYNYDEQVFAADQAALHALPVITPNDMASRNTYIAAKPADELFMDETGAAVPGNQHDVLTGSNPDGTFLTGNTCQDWTSDSGDDMAMLGHSDTPAAQYSPSWNNAHASSGCGTQDLISTGGEGRIYCFATD